MISVLKDLFSRKLLVDDRVPITVLQTRNYRVDLLPPTIEFNLQIISIILFDIVVSSILGMLIYKYVINSDSQRTARAVGCGAILPLSFWIPFEIANVLDIRSPCLRMGLCCVPLCTGLRCLEAISGYTPDFCMKSMSNYVIYCSSLLQIKAGSVGPLKFSWASLGSSLRQYLTLLAIMSLLFSWLVPRNFELFQTDVEPTELPISLEPWHLCNNFVAAWLMSLTLAFSMSGVSVLIQLLLGVQTETVVDNPMFSSTSPSDFWGRKWNRLVHTGLKHGVYKAVRRETQSKIMATLATFLASGLLHEYVSVLLFFPTIYQDVSEMKIPHFGKHILFFGWNGCLLVIEYFVGSSFGWITKALPLPVVSLLVVLTALPVGHWFTGDMIELGYFTSLQMAFPIWIVTKR